MSLICITRQVFFCSTCVICFSFTGESQWNGIRKQSASEQSHGQPERSPWRPSRRHSEPRDVHIPRRKSSQSIAPETAAEDLCGLVLNILSTVLWQGIDGSSSHAWGKRAEVIVSLDMVALSNYLYRKPEELKRRLYEMAIQVVTSDVKKDPMKTANMENSELVVRLVHGELSWASVQTLDKCSKRMSFFTRSYL